MQLQIPLSDLSKPENIEFLASKLSELGEQLDTLYSLSAPNGNISARQGRICIYNNSGTYTTFINVDGATTWQEVGTAVDFTAIATSVISDTDNTDDLGSSAKQWKDLYINGLAYIDQLGENLDCNDKQLTNLIIENRTDDTGMTVTGQIWIRVD